ncbi:15692_t:CDS:1 [Funneliformis mosseae]|uniref:15692_t:CDS:1 n=1 Tax=Funneliformis mosseae TaxID=27381 RepID=A0A9N8Z1J2_FUNMO|nr:15692_t:CDS:1 [Funneliformis mosseae]
MNPISTESNEKRLLHRSTKNKLKIKLVESTIILHGSPEESLGCFLRGELILNLAKLAKIKRLELKFLGKIKLFIPHTTGEIAASNNYIEKEVISHNWTFIDQPQDLINNEDDDSSVHNNKSLTSRLFHSLSKSSTSKKSFKYHHVLSKGIHTFPFELFLPGTLPESINTNIGKINYKVTAKVTKSGIFSRIRKSQYVTILRTISDEWNQGKVVSNDWNDLCRYEISFLKKAFPIGDCVKIDLKLMPKDKVKLDLQYVHIDLVERSVYNITSDSQQSLQESTICGIKINDFIKEWIDKDSNNLSSHIFNYDKNDFQQQNEDVEGIDESLELCYHETISFRIPNLPYIIHPSYTSDPITISHELRFLFNIKVHGKNQSKIKKFKLIIPIIILSAICKDDVLPLYDDSDNDSLISKNSWDEISLDDISSPPSYESSVSDGRNGSFVNCEVYNDDDKK